VLLVPKSDAWIGIRAPLDLDRADGAKTTRLACVPKNGGRIGE
jgi:hypothetical protein